MTRNAWAAQTFKNMPPCDASEQTQVRSGLRGAYDKQLTNRDQLASRAKRPLSEDALVQCVEA
jgi:hypothetical protein